MKKETKELLSAKEFYQIWVEKQPFTEKVLFEARQIFQKQRWFNFAKDYANYLHQAKLNEVTDEVIDKKAEKHPFLPLRVDKIAFMSGAKWLRDYLKKN